MQPLNEQHFRHLIGIVAAPVLCRMFFCLQWQPCPNPAKHLTALHLQKQMFHLPTPPTFLFRTGLLCDNGIPFVGICFPVYRQSVYQHLKIHQQYLLLHSLNRRHFREGQRSTFPYPAFATFLNSA